MLENSKYSGGAAMSAAVARFGSWSASRPVGSVGHSGRNGIADNSGASRKDYRARRNPETGSTRRQGVAVKDWTEFGLRPLPVMSARSRVVEVPPIQGLIDALYDECNAALEVPLRGITSDGNIVPGLFGVGAQLDRHRADSRRCARLHPGTRSCRSGDRDVSARQHRTSRLVQRAHELLPSRRDVGEPAHSAARARPRHVARHLVGSRLRAGAQHHALERGPLPGQRQPRRVRRMALLHHHLRDPFAG